MKHFFFSVLFLISVYSNLIGQNKTLGVGVTTPNPNAALHVGSPTNNQGFLMPTLNTIDRTAISLGSGDAGLMVYDTDLKNICTWDGSTWVTSAKPFPVNETITNSVAGSSLFRIVNSGTAAGNFGVASFENTNPNSGFSAIYGSTTSTINGVADFVINSPTNNNDGIGVTTNGVGTAGRFTVNNTGGLNPAIWAQTNSDQPLSATIYGLNTGKGDAAGAFRINNASSNFSALYAETNGGGAGVYGINKNTGAGFAVGVQGEVNTTVFGIGVFGKHTGTSGFAGSFEVTNAASTASGVKGFTIGSGSGVYGENAGSGNGFSALFANTNSGNTYPAVQASTKGTGPGVRVIQDATGVGGGMDIIIQNASNSSLGFSVDHQGTGRAGQFNISNSSSGATALVASSVGTGFVLQVNSNNTGNTSPALGVNHSGGGTAGYFVSNNATSSATALFAESNGSGSAITASQINNGLALNILNGGLHYNVTTVGTAGSIASRSAIYQITTTGVFTLGWTPTAGDVIFVFNGNGSSITFEGLTINAGVLAQLIYIGGSWRTNI